MKTVALCIKVISKLTIKVINKYILEFWNYTDPTTIYLAEHEFYTTLSSQSTNVSA